MHAIQTNPLARPGVTLIPEMAVPIETRSAAVAIARLRPPRPSRTIGMVWRKTNPLAGQLAQIAEIVRRTSLNDATDLTATDPPSNDHRPAGREPPAPEQPPHPPGATPYRAPTRRRQACKCRAGVGRPSPGASALRCSSATNSTCRLVAVLP